MLQKLKRKKEVKNANCFTFIAPSKLAATLRDVAFNERVNISDIIVDALYDYFEKNNISVNKEEE